MNIGDAVAVAMRNILDEKEMTCADIERNSRVRATTIQQITRGARKTKSPSITSIHEFCCGTGYTLAEFFERKEFDDLE